MAIILSAFSTTPKPTLPGVSFQYQNVLATRQILNGFHVELPQLLIKEGNLILGPVPHHKTSHRCFVYRPHHGQSSAEDFPNFDDGPYKPPTYVPPNYTELKPGFFYLDLFEGYEERIREGQKVIFNFEKFNCKRESVETHSRQELRIGRKKYGSGLDEGLKGMKKMGRRRLIIPPKLLPPRTGFGTSRRQYRIFEVTVESIQD